jgi:hypothetical protein
VTVADTVRRKTFWTSAVAVDVTVAESSLPIRLVTVAELVTVASTGFPTRRTSDAVDVTVAVTALRMTF